MSSPFDGLVREAIAVCQQLTGDVPSRINMSLVGGGFLAVPIPHHDLAFARPEDLSVWPPPTGWAFRPGEVAYGGVTFRLSGKPFAVLKLLAERGDAGCTIAELKRLVWNDPGLADKLVWNAVSYARRVVVKALGLGPVDPLPPIADGYALNISPRTPSLFPLEIAS